MPIRAVFSEMGFQVDWLEESRTAVIINDEYNVEVPADATEFFVNGKSITLQLPQRIIDGGLYLPLRAVADATGADVQWDSETRTVFITNKSVYNKDSIDFAYKLNQYMPEDKNYVVSPISIKLAMSMAVNGADGETKNEILNTFNIEDIDVYNSYIKELISYYEQDNSSEYVSDLIFNIANSIWLNESRAGGIKFSGDFSRIMKNYFSATSDVVNDNNAVSEINSWVDDKTNGLIDKIIDSPDFLGALVNACYFKGNWRYEFSEHLTAPDTFTYRNGEKAEIDFMHLQEDLKYYADDDVQMVSLPYDGLKNVSMYVILSNDNRLDFSQYFDKCEYKLVDVSMPKFKIEYSVTLNDILKTMGIEKAFSDKVAEFKPMFENYSPDTLFYIDKVLHKAYIDVDEKGTEAAAVTAVMMECTAAIVEQPTPISFVADKPFTYVIRDNENKEILFMGEFACK